MSSRPENPDRPTITAILTTFNEERNVAECLESLEWCDEILVVDSFSTDRTPEIAQTHPKVSFRQHAYYGGAAQKNWSMRFARSEWILFFDADERCTPGLRREIEARLASRSPVNAYGIRRRAYFLGRRIRFSGWHNERVVRLVRRGTAGYQNKRVHAQMVTDGPAPTLDNPLDHYMVQDLGEYVQRVVRYGIWGAAQAFVDGKRAGAITMLFRPSWRFFRTYVLQGGILDGLSGLVFCYLQAHGTFVKWSVLRSWRMQARAGIAPKLPEFDTSSETWSLVPGASRSPRERGYTAS